jgi:hypothetical protein
MSLDSEPIEISEDAASEGVQSPLNRSMVMEGIDGGVLDVSVASLPSVAAFEGENSQVIQKMNSGHNLASLGVDEGVMVENVDEVVGSDNEDGNSSETSEELVYVRRRGGIVRGKVREVHPDPEEPKAPRKLTVEAARRAEDAPRAVMYPTMRARPHRQRIALEDREAIVSILTSESSGDEARDYLLQAIRVTRNSYGQGISNVEKETLTRHVKTISQLDPHTMRPTAYRPIRAQEFHEFDLHMANVPWYTDLSQFGVFQNTVLTQWPAHYYKPRFDRFRRTESRFVHSTDPTAEDLVFENTTAQGYPYQLKAGTTILYQNPRIQKPVDVHQPWRIPPLTPAVTTEFPFEDDEPPLVRSLMPNEDTCDDFLPERTGMVDDEYEGSAILGGDRTKYSMPYLEETDIQLMEKMEGEIRAIKRGGLLVPKHHSNETFPFESVNKRALPAAQALFHMAPVDAAQDRETVDDHVVVLQSLSHALEDSWQTLLDHYTRVERRNRRWKREQARKERKAAEHASKARGAAQSSETKLQFDDESDLMTADIKEDQNETAMDIDVSVASDMDMPALHHNEMDMDGEYDPITQEDEDEGAMADNEDENDEADLSASHKEVNQDITANIELAPSELLKQFEGEELDDWVARLACIIGEDFYRYTMDAEDLEGALNASAVAQGGVLGEEFGHEADLEVLEAPEKVKPEIVPVPESVIVPTEESDSSVAKLVHMPPKRGSKRKHEDPEAELGAEGFGEDTTEPRKLAKERGSKNRANRCYNNATATIPPDPPLAPFVEEDLAPLSPMAPFRISRPTHEFLVSEVASLLNEVLDGLLVHSAEVYKEREANQPRLDQIFATTRSHEIVVNELMRVSTSPEVKIAFERKCELIFLDHNFQKLWPRGIKDSLKRHKIFLSRPLNPYQVVPRFSRSRKVASQNAPAMDWAQACEIVGKLAKFSAKRIKKKTNLKSARAEPSNTQNAVSESLMDTDAPPKEVSEALRQGETVDATIDPEVEALRALPVPTHFIMPPLEKTPELDVSVYLMHEDDDFWTKDWKRAMNRAHRYQRLRYARRVKKAEDFIMHHQKQTGKGLRLQYIPEDLRPYVSQEFTTKRRRDPVDPEANVDAPPPPPSSAKATRKKIPPLNQDLAAGPPAPRKRGRPPKPKP